MYSALTTSMLVFLNSFLNIPSILLVTAKPPNIFMLAMKIAMLASTNDIVSVIDIWVIAPMIIMLQLHWSQTLEVCAMMLLHSK